MTAPVGFWAMMGDPSAKSIDEIIFCFPGFAASSATGWRTRSMILA